MSSRYTPEQAEVAILRLYTMGPDTVVAADPDDAWAAWEEHRGETRADYDGEEWDPIPGDKCIRVWCDADGNVCEPEDDGAEVIEKTAAEWAAKLGRGFAWSTEW